MEPSLSSPSHKSDDVSVHSDPSTTVDKSTAPTSLQRFGSLTENNETLQLKVAQLTKELEDSKAESDAIKVEFNRYKVDSQDYKKWVEHVAEIQKIWMKSEGQLNEMRSEVKTKSEEIQNLKINEAELKNRISQLVDEINIKSTNISLLTMEIKESKGEIDRYKREIEDEKGIWKRELDTIKTEFDEMKKVADSKTEDIENLKLVTIQRGKTTRRLESEVQLKSNDINFLEKSEAQLKTQLTEMKNEAKAKSEEIENLKMESQDNKNTLELDIQLKSNEIQCLKKSEAEMMYRISQLENEVNSKSAKIEKLNFEISQTVRKIHEKVETNSIDLRSLHNKATEMTIRAKFTDISKLTSTRVYSQSTEFTGLNWRIYLCKDDDHLSFYMEARAKNMDKWSCLAIVDKQLISQANLNIVYAKKDAKEYTDSHGWGFSKFISYKDLFDEEKGYVKEDSIIVAATIKAFPDAQ